MDSVVSIKDLKTYFFTDAGVAKAVDGISLDLPVGKTTALVGESGCGKSVTALSILRLIPNPPGQIVEGEIWFQGKNLLRESEEHLRRVRGNGISMIFQEPMTSLNPVFRVGNQVAAAIRHHRKLTKQEALDETIDLFKKVGIPAPETRIYEYPHQMSGGMRQRVMIAMALACRPALLIADEPTTALDVTIQAQILALLRHLQNELGMAILLITHDLGIVAENADHVAIMYAGKVVEQTTVSRLFQDPKHPYTQGLFESLPGRHKAGEPLKSIPGQVPAATQFPAGCRFHPRCPHAMEICTITEPKLESVNDGHTTACWLYQESNMKTEETNPIRKKLHDS